MENLVPPLPDADVVEPTMSTRAARKAAQPQRILAAALEIFGEKGFAATRMEDVAAKVGITKGAIYLYFPSKQALLEALVQRDVSPSMRKVTEMLKTYDGPLEPVLRRIIATAHMLIQGDVLPTYMRLVVGESGNFPDLARFYFNETVTLTLGALNDLFVRAMERGEIRRADPDTLSRLFMAPVIKSIVWRVVFRGIEDEPFDQAPLLDEHISLFLRGLAPDEVAVN